jgi:phage-related protein
MKDGINNNLLQFSLKFQNLDAKKATAIIHFLTARAGVEYFYFKPPAPYSVYKRFVCDNFSSDNTFVNNFNVSATFREVSP